MANEQRDALRYNFLRDVLGWSAITPWQADMKGEKLDAAIDEMIRNWTPEWQARLHALKP